ncbi:MAG: acylamino-acid-releasing enzyme [Symbiobacteriaceae bacterium]|jgi:dipeptidyl aminopeptidase/acylaminoacyl peptidase|nr:acylamino-acid-releasing enzyme [Symbiobacteriaceae bacterium]
MSRFTFAQFAATRRITGFEPAPDGNAVYFIADSSGQFNLWRVAAEGGWPEQLTQFSEESVRDLVVSEDGRQIAFLADPKGSEVNQVYLMAAQGGWPVQATDLPSVRHGLGCFSPDGRYLAYCANATTPRDMDIYLRDLQTGETRQLTPGGRLMYPAWFSPDGTHLLAVQPMSNTNHDLWVINAATGEARNLTEHAGRQASYFPGAWRGDSKGFWFFTNDGREFMGMGYCDVASGQKEIVLTADWDMERLAVSHRHGLMAYCINEAGNSRLRVVHLATGCELPLPELPKGVVGNLRFATHDERRRLFLSMNCSNQAAAIYVVDLDRQELRLLTPSMLGNLPADTFVSPELVEVEAFDGLKIPAWLYRPHGIKAGETVPALLAVHGGPEIQERPEYRYNGFYQYLLSQGVAVLAPNVRGSTGFGISWQKQVHRDWGGGDLKDLEACARYLQSLDWVDGSKLGVWGQSYGGFATLSCAARLPGYWACAGDFYGPANLVTFAASGPPTWKHVIKSWIGDPEEDRELLVERSPITYADQIKCPLLVMQGATDTRVVRAESDQMVERLRELGREVEYVVFEDEGHGFTKRTNQLRSFELLSNFLLRHLKA